MTDVELPAPPTDETPASPEQTRTALLEHLTRRGPGFSPAFIQEHGGARRPGPLGLFVNERRIFALRMYLLLHALALAEPWDATLPAATWARALDATKPSAESSVSRNWHWLEEKQLVRTARRNRMVQATLLADDGYGGNYQRPKSYFVLPHEFFLDGWFNRLSLPATAVLLIGMNKSRREAWFQLRTEPESEWYRISADSLQRGLDELRDKEILRINSRSVREPRARFGAVRVNEYLLLPPFHSPRWVMDLIEPDPPGT